MEQFLNIISALTPVLVILGWVALAALVVWGGVRLARKHKAKSN